MTTMKGPPLSPSATFPTVTPAPPTSYPVPPTTPAPTTSPTAAPPPVVSAPPATSPPSTAAKLSTMAAPRVSIFFAALTLSLLVYLAESRSDSNSVYSPYADTTIQKSDGFSFGIAFSARGDFFVNTSVQLSPCDKRLSLSQLGLFRPKVDEISLLTINTTTFSPDSTGLCNQNKQL
ncbi:unnamed protein product [Camellia sinensis]